MISTEVSSLATHNSINLPKQRDRMAALAAAQMEMSAIVSETADYCCVGT
jgi:hypothetical protein